MEGHFTLQSCLEKCFSVTKILKLLVINSEIMYVCRLAGNFIRYLRMAR